MVKAALLHAAQRRQLRQHHLGDPDGVHQRQPASAAGAQTTRRSSANTRSGATSASAGAAARRERQGLRLDREAQLAGQPGQAQGPQRIALEGHGRDGPQPARAQVLQAAERIDVARRPSGAAIALMVRSRRARSSSIVAPSSGSRSSCQLRSWATTRQAPNASDSSNANPPAVRPSARASSPADRPWWRRRSRPCRGRARGRGPRRRPASRRARSGRSAASGSLTAPAPRRGGSGAAPAPRSRTAPRG